MANKVMTARVVRPMDIARCIPTLKESQIVNVLLRFVDEKTEELNTYHFSNGQLADQNWRPVIVQSPLFKELAAALQSLVVEMDGKRCIRLYPVIFVEQVVANTSPILQSAKVGDLVVSHAVENVIQAMREAREFFAAAIQNAIDENADMSTILPNAPATDFLEEPEQEQTALDQDVIADRAMSALRDAGVSGAKSGASGMIPCPTCGQGRFIHWTKAIENGHLAAGCDGDCEFAMRQ